MIRLAERTWPEAARLARDPRSVVLLPLGAIEQHGPHLPLLVDWRGAEELARRVAPHLRRAGWRPVPTLRRLIVELETAFMLAIERRLVRERINAPAPGLVRLPPSRSRRRRLFRLAR